LYFFSIAPLFDEKDISESNKNSNNNQQQPAGPVSVSTIISLILT